MKNLFAIILIALISSITLADKAMAISDLATIFDDEVEEPTRCDTIPLDTPYAVKKELDLLPQSDGMNCIFDRYIDKHISAADPVICGFLPEVLNYAVSKDNWRGATTIAQITCRNRSAFEAQNDYMKYHSEKIPSANMIHYMSTPRIWLDGRPEHLERVAEIAVTDVEMLNRLLRNILRKDISILERHLLSNLKKTKINWSNYIPISKGEKTLFQFLSWIPIATISDIVDIIKFQAIVDTGMSFGFNLKFWNTFLSAPHSHFSFNLDGVGLINTISIMQIASIRGESEFLRHNMNKAIKLIQSRDFNVTPPKRELSLEDRFVLSMIQLSLKNGLPLDPFYKRYNIAANSRTAFVDLLLLFDNRSLDLNYIKELNSLLIPVREWEKLGMEQCSWEYLYRATLLEDCESHWIKFNDGWITSFDCTPEEAYSKCINGEISTPEQKQLNQEQYNNEERFFSDDDTTLLIRRVFSSIKTIQAGTDITINGVKYAVLPPSVFFIATKDFTTIKFTEFTEQYNELEGSINGAIHYID